MQIFDSTIFLDYNYDMAIPFSYIGQMFFVIKWWDQNILIKKTFMLKPFILYLHVLCFKNEKKDLRFKKGEKQ